MCTTVGFSYEHGFVFGRTLEMGVRLDHQVLYVPKNHKGFIKEDEVAFDSRYAVIGTSFLNMAAFGDGINEVGLMGSNNLLPGYASYSSAPAEGKINLTISSAFNYLLSRCKDVEDVRTEAEKLNILEQGPSGESTPGGMHFFFMDAAGKGLVLEPKEGRLLVYDNPYGVLTNAPEFPWHTTNLKNYMNLQPENIEQRLWNDTPLTKFGEGSGLTGLPGDFSPTSRFVRAAFFVSETPKNLKRRAAILQGFRILSQSDIPTGSVTDPAKGYSDETLYTSMMDTEKRGYFVKCHDNINIQSFYLDDFQDEQNIRFVQLQKEMTL